MEDENQTIDDFLENQLNLINLEFEEEKAYYEKFYEISSFELEKSGLCLNNVVCKSLKIGLYGRTLATFTKPYYNDKIPDKSFFKLPNLKFGPGDNISIFKTMPYFLDEKILISGIIHKKTNYKITIAFEKYLEVPNELDTDKVSIIITSNEVTHKRYKKVLSRIKTIKKENYPENLQSSHLIKVLLGIEKNNSPNKHSKKILTKTFENKLNSEQNEAILSCLKAENVGIIHGPPGTGKTVTICELISIVCGKKVEN